MYHAELVPKVCFLFTILVSLGTNFVNQDVLPHLTILMEELEVLVLMCTRTRFSVLEQLQCGNSGTTTGL